MNAVVITQDTSILLPPARIVQGDLYDPQTTDMDGNPLLINSGPNKGQPRVNFFFALAVRKTPGVIHWSGEPALSGQAESWGAKIWRLTHMWWPTMIDAQARYITHKDFAWKIKDGDDQTPNLQAGGKRNCDREGFAGCWIISAGSMFETKIFDANGQPLLTKGLVRCGYWVEAYINIKSNENAKKPGIYINHSMVAYRAPDKEIVGGPDARNIGFGRAALPAGINAAPTGNIANLPAVSPTTPPVPGIPGAVPTPAYAPGIPAAAAPVTPGIPAMPGFPGAVRLSDAAPVAVTPHPGFLQPPSPGMAAPALPPAAPAAVAPPPSVIDPLGAPTGYKMMNLNGPRYEAFRGQGWQDAQLLQNGHMVRL